MAGSSAEGFKGLETGAALLAGASEAAALALVVFGIKYLDQGRARRGACLKGAKVNGERRGGNPPELRQLRPEVLHVQVDQ